MQNLLRLGCKIKTIDGLHSKIYCNGDQVVIGSSNASSNGLASDLNRFSGNVEANALIIERSFVDAVHRWFDEHWKISSTRSVTPTLIAESKPIWLKNSSVHRQFVNGLLSQMRQDPEMVRKVRARVVYYHMNSGSASAQSTFNLHGRAQYSDAEWRFLNGDLPFYEDHAGWDVKPGDVFLDFQCSKPKARAIFDGIWRVRKNPYIYVGNSKKHRVILLEKLTDIDGLRVSRSDQKEMERAIDRYMKTDPSRWEADRHGDFLDMSFADFWREVILSDERAGESDG